MTPDDVDPQDTSPCRHNRIHDSHVTLRRSSTKDSGPKKSSKSEIPDKRGKSNEKKRVKEIKFLGEISERHVVEEGMDQRSVNGGRGVFNLTEKEPTNILDVISEEKEEEELFTLPKDSEALCRQGTNTPHSLTLSATRPDSQESHRSHYDEDDIVSTNSDIDFGGDDIHDEKAWDTDLEQEDKSETYDHSGRNAYIEGCKHLGVIPASYFLRHMHDRSLDMRHHGLGSTGIKAISISLVSNAHVMKLNLSDNWLGKDGSLAICDMLKENCFITELNLSENRLRSEFVEALTDALQTNTTLTHINISGNSIGDRGAELFANIINNTKRLENLNLSNNNLSEWAGVMLGPAIGENSCIKSLDLSWNSIRRKGAVAVAVGIKNNVYLKKMNLAWNGFGTEGACALGDALKSNAALEELDISNNRIMTEGAVWMGKGLAVNENLTVLKMCRNPMESAGCFAVCASLLRNPTSVLRYLDFTDIEANDDCVKIMKDMKAMFPDITVVYGSRGDVHATRTRIHPMYKLRHYMDKHSLRIVDFFNKFDKDRSLSVTRKEFIQGIVETGIKMTEEEIEVLVQELDKDGDGEVNYSELVTGEKDYEDKERMLQSEPMITIKQ